MEYLTRGLIAVVMVVMVSLKLEKSPLKLSTTNNFLQNEDKTNRLKGMQKEHPCKNFETPCTYLPIG